VARRAALRLRELLHLRDDGCDPLAKGGQVLRQQAQRQVGADLAHEGYEAGDSKRRHER
jgi:hypothetical protein